MSMARIGMRMSKFVWSFKSHPLKNEIGLCHLTAKTIARSSSVLINRMRKDLNVPALCGVIIASEGNNKNLEDKIIHQLTIAKLAAIDSDFINAHDNLLKTLRTSREVNYPQGTVCAYDELATLAKSAGKYDEAEKYIKDTIEYLLEQGIAEDSNLVVNFRLKLSRLYQKKRDYEAADSEFDRCLKIQKQSVTFRGDDETRILLAMVLFWCGKYHFENQKFEASKALLEDCHLVLTKLPHQLISQKIIVLYNLGEVCHALGEFNNALRYFTDASALGESERGSPFGHFLKETRTWLKSRYLTLVGGLTKHKANDITQIFPA